MSCSEGRRTGALFTRFASVLESHVGVEGFFAVLRSLEILGSLDRGRSARAETLSGTAEVSASLIGIDAVAFRLSCSVLGWLLSKLLTHGLAVGVHASVVAIEVLDDVFVTGVMIATIETSSVDADEAIEDLAENGTEIDEGILLVHGVRLRRLRVGEGNVVTTEVVTLEAGVLRLLGHPVARILVQRFVDRLGVLRDSEGNVLRLSEDDVLASA